MRVLLPKLIQTLSFVAVLAIATLTQAAAQAQTQTCVDLFKQAHFSIHEGRLVTDALEKRTLLPHIAAGSVIRHLGEGIAGGHVYRIEEPSGSKYVLKEYREPESLQRDESLLAILRRAVEQAKLIFPREDHFDVVRSRQLSPTLMKISYTPGRTLSELTMEKSPLSETAQDQLDANYQRLLHQIRVVVAPTTVGRTESTIYVGRLMLFLKKSNIVVDPKTLRMTIIDPF